MQAELVSCQTLKSTLTSQQHGVDWPESMRMSCSNSPCESAVYGVHVLQARTDAQLQDVKVCSGITQFSSWLGQLPDFEVNPDLTAWLQGLHVASVVEAVLHSMFL